MFVVDPHLIAPAGDIRSGVPIGDIFDDYPIYDIGFVGQAGIIYAREIKQCGVFHSAATGLRALELPKAGHKTATRKRPMPVSAVHWQLYFGISCPWFAVPDSKAGHVNLSLLHRARNYCCAIKKPPRRTARRVSWSGQSSAILRHGQPFAPRPFSRCHALWHLAHSQRTDSGAA